MRAPDPHRGNPVSFPQIVSGSVGILFHAELRPATHRFTGCSESGRGPLNRCSAPAQCARLWTDPPPPPRISSKLNLLIAFLLPAPGDGMNGAAVNRGRAGARSRRGRVPQEGLPAAASRRGEGPPPCCGNLRPCALPAPLARGGWPRPRR